MAIYFDSNRGPQLERYEIEFGDLEADLLDDGPHTIDSVGKKNPRRGMKRKPSKTPSSTTMVVSIQPVDTQKGLPLEIERVLRTDLLRELGEAAMGQQDYIEGGELIGE
jgi:hypothetical protein